MTKESEANSTVSESANEILERTAAVAAKDADIMRERLLKILNWRCMWTRFPELWKELNVFFELDCTRFEIAAHEIGELCKNGGIEESSYTLHDMIKVMQEFCLQCQEIAMLAYSKENFNNPRLIEKQTNIVGEDSTITQWLYNNCMFLYNESYNIQQNLIEYYFKRKDE